jgi:hypothetical protein
LSAPAKSKKAKKEAKAEEPLAENVYVMDEFERVVLIKL